MYAAIGLVGSDSELHPDVVLQRSLVERADEPEATGFVADHQRVWAQNDLLVHHPLVHLGDEEDVGGDIGLRDLVLP